MKPVSVTLSDYSDSAIFGLVEEVQKYPFLFDIQPHQRSNLDLLAKREEVWFELGTQFGLPGPECFSLWRKLRASFVRYFKIYQSSKDSEKPYNPNNWKYFDSLLFLIPYIDYGEAKPHLGQSGQSAVSHFAKKALKRSKNILLKNKESQDGQPDECAEEAPHVYRPYANRIDISELIRLVKLHPIIYQTSGASKSKTSADQRLAAWKLIGEEMRCSPTACMKKWKYLKIKLRTTNRFKWKWFPLMEYFLGFQSSRSPRHVGYPTDLFAASAAGDVTVPALEFSEQRMTTASRAPDMVFDSQQYGVIGSLMNGEHSISLADQPPPLGDMENGEDSASMVAPPSSVSNSGRMPVSASAGGLKYSEYHFGMCVAQMMEEIPRPARAVLKAKILSMVAAMV